MFYSFWLLHCFENDFLSELIGLKFRPILWSSMPYQRSICLAIRHQRHILNQRRRAQKRHVQGLLDDLFYDSDDEEFIYVTYRLYTGLVQQSSNRLWAPQISLVYRTNVDVSSRLGTVSSPLCIQPSISSEWVQISGHGGEYPFRYPYTPGIRTTRVPA